MRSGSPQVAVVQALLPHYRVGFFERLRDELEARGVTLHLFHGQPYDENAAKGGAVRIPWAIDAPNRVWRLGRRSLTWQSGYRALRGMDLVVCEQATSQLLLYAMWERYLVQGQRLALWGHGRNFQPGRASPIGEALKRVVSRRVHWWFAYNQHSASVVRELGMPAQRITDVHNAIDTTALQLAAAALDDAEVHRLRTSLGVGGQHVCLYVGAMYREKRIAYLLQVCLELRRLVPDFHMLFIGAGPDEPLVAAAAAQHSWIHHLGGVFDTARVPYFALADLQLMPGLVGLGLLDSFALGVPLVTLADSEHSPEMAYLEPGENGVVLPSGTTPEAYAAHVAELLLDSKRRGALAEGCLRSAGRYTVEAMAERFADGVMAALAAPLPVPRLRVSRVDASTEVVQR